MANYSDDFNRATLGANWTAINGGTWDIVSSARARQTQSDGVYRALRYAAQMDGADVDVSVTVQMSSSAAAGILVRAPGSGTNSAAIDGYAIMAFQGDAFYLLRMDDGADTGVGYSYAWGSVAVSTDYTLRITVAGSTVTGYVNGTQRFQFTDSLYAGGAGGRGVALMSYGATPQYDNFSAADISSGSHDLTATNLLAGAPVLGTPSMSGTNALTASSVVTGSPTLATPTIGQVHALDAAVDDAALRFYGNAASQIDRVRIPLEDGDSTQYPVNVGAGDFTYDVWLRCAYADNDSTATDEDARYSNIVLDRDSWGEQRGHVVLGVTRNGSDLVACFGQAGSGGTWSTIFSTTNIGDSEWHHVAVTRTVSTGVVRIWVDGVQEASATYDTSDWSYPAGHTVGSGQDNEYLVIGTEKHDVGYGYNGQLDELRISDSVRYTATFTPAKRFEPDANAVGLYHCDEASGTVLVDFATVSGSPTDGELLVGGSPSGPVWVVLSEGATAGVPVLGSPTAAQSHVLTSVSIVAGVPVPGVPTVGQTHVLTATSVTAGTPTAGTPTITQAHVLTAVSIVAGSPVVASATIGQTHVLTADAIITGAPVVGNASMTGENALSALSVVAGEPAVGTPTLAQVHVLTAAAIVTDAPIVGESTIAQTHALAADDLLAGTPTLGDPGMSGEVALTAASIVSGAPLPAESTIGQVHVLTAEPIVTGSPVVGSPTIGQVHALTAVSVTVGSPVCGSPSMTQIHAIVALFILASSPTLGSPSLDRAAMAVPDGRVLRIVRENRLFVVAAESRTIPVED